MPIAGVTTRDALDSRFKVLGKLRKGAPKQTNAPGKDLEYFRFTSDNDAVVKAFREAYGDKPDSIEVYFQYPTMEQNFSTWRELYRQNHLLKARCDGDYIVAREIGTKMVTRPVLCDKPYKDVEGRPPCPECPLKPIGRLSVILVPLLEAGFVGTVTVEMHGWNELNPMAAQLAQYEPLTGREFRVYREKTRIGRPDKASNTRKATDKWLVFVEPTQETALMLIGDAQRRARAALLGEPVQPVAQLPAGEPLTPDLVVEPGELVLEEEPPPEQLTEEEIPFSEPPQEQASESIAEPVCTWIRGDPGTRFFAWLSQNNISTEEARQALGVDSFNDYPGTVGDAKTTIMASKKEQSE